MCAEVTDTVSKGMIRVWRNDHDALRALVFIVPNRLYCLRQTHTVLYTFFETEREQMALHCRYFNARNDQEIQITSGYVITCGLHPGHRIVVTDRQTVESPRPRNRNYPLHRVVTIDRIIRVHVQIERERSGHCIGTLSEREGRRV